MCDFKIIVYSEVRVLNVDECTIHSLISFPTLKMPVTRASTRAKAKGTGSSTHAKAKSASLGQPTPGAKAKGTGSSTHAKAIHYQTFLEQCNFSPSISNVMYLPSGPDDCSEEDSMFNDLPQPHICAGDIVLHRAESNGSIVTVCKFVTYCKSIGEDEDDKQPIVTLSADGMGLTYFGSALYLMNFLVSTLYTETLNL